MTVYLFDVTCHSCGSPVRHVTSGRVEAGSYTSAIVACSECTHEWQMTLTLRRSPTMAAVRQGKHRHG